MTDPHKQLRQQLNHLIKTGYFYLRGLTDELERIKQWDTPERRSALALSSFFFNHVIYTFSRTVLVEICKLLATKGGERSLIAWLGHARTHAKALKPTRYVPEYPSGEHRPVSVEEYRAIIDEHVAEIEQRTAIIDNIKARRDKAIAHADPNYFAKPGKLHENFPLDGAEVDELIWLIGDILRQHHVLLLQSDLSMSVKSGSHVDNVLRFARAFARIRKDMDLIRSGFRPVDYLRDEQDDEENPLY